MSLAARSRPVLWECRATFWTDVYVSPDDDAKDANDAGPVRTSRVEVTTGPFGRHTCMASSYHMHRQARGHSAPARLRSMGQPTRVCATGQKPVVAKPHPPAHPVSWALDPVPQPKTSVVLGSRLRTACLSPPRTLAPLDPGTLNKSSVLAVYGDKLWVLDEKGSTKRKKKVGK